MPSQQSALMETETLNARLNEPNLQILDASYHIPPSPRNAQAEYVESHIPGALFFDIDAIADTNSNLPHMLPSPEEFERHMQRLKLTAGDTIVVYDSQGIMSAPRAWWMFRYFGHEQVFVLNGGLLKWVAENRPVQSGLPDMQQESDSQRPAFKAQVHPQLLCGLATLEEAVCSYQENKHASFPFQIVDMRSAGRFNGVEPEPRPGLKSGHIPGSLNAPWSSWLNPDKTLLSPHDLAVKCQQIGLDFESSTVTTCGSGITACVGTLALYELGNTSTAVYDGAWAEWGSLADAPIA